MKRIFENIANRLVGLNELKDKIKEDIEAFMRGNNGMIVAAIVFGTISVFSSCDLYKDSRKLWLALIPIGLFLIFFFVILVSEAYKEKTKYRNRSSRMRLVGFHMDFNERILRRIYGSLTQYEFLDEDLTSFADFYNVLVLDFEEHDSVLHFNCTQPQLKYVLEKFKQFKKGLRLKTFERSEKIYHKGNRISSEVLSKKYNEFPPWKESEQLIDSFFDFLGDN